MILLVRHLTLLLWFSLVPGLVLVFWILPRINQFFPDHDLPVAAATIAMVLLFIEWAMTRLGERRLIKRLNSAESWDRAGITSKAEHQYLKALESYASGMISPLGLRRMEPVLLASLAKFSLSSTPSHGGFQGAIRESLRISPQDGGIASLWLKRLCRKSELSRKDHETITRVAEAQVDNPEITALCARLFIESGRTDYAAQKVYRAFKSSLNPDQRILAGIQELMVPEVLADGMGDAMAEVMAKKSMNDDLSDNRPFVRIFKKAVVLLKAYHASFRQQESLKRFLRWSTILVGLAALTTLGINTLVHLIYTPPKETTVEVSKTEKSEKSEQIEREMPGRFTIQVAAYLKKTHADDFLKKLKQKGLEAYIHKADGGGRTWYIVRISQFSDRQSAAQYGTNLKGQGLIDDFFVDNSE